jgi:hypothetical protein
VKTADFFLPIGHTEIEIDSNTKTIGGKNEKN